MKKGNTENPFGLDWMLLGVEMIDDHTLKLLVSSEPFQKIFTFEVFVEFLNPRLSNIKIKCTDISKENEARYIMCILKNDSYTRELIQVIALMSEQLSVNTNIGIEWTIGFEYTTENDIYGIILRVYQIIKRFESDLYNFVNAKPDDSIEE